MSKLNKLLNLPAKQRRLLLVTYVQLNCIRLGLWLLPFKVLKQWLVVKATPSCSSITVKDIVRAVKQSSRYTPGGAKCLARALTTEVMMKKHGYEPKLLFGAIKQQQKLMAHAWIEYQGQVIIGQVQNLSSFAVLTSNTSKSIKD